MFKTVLAGAAALLVSTTPWAQGDFPSKPVRIVVPFAAGGSVDAASRLVGQKLAERLGKPVIVENRAGAGGTLGSEYVAKAPPDGYTVIWGTVSTHAINASVYATLRYDNIKDFAPITLVMEQPLLMVVPAESPVKSLQDLIQAQKANPGKATFGSPGPGTTGHLTGELLKKMYGMDMVHVPYKGSHPMLTDLIGGRLDLGIDNMPSSLAQVKSGRARALAITSLKRSPLAPDIPALSETIPGFQVVAWQAMFAPAGTPEPILDRLSRDVRAVLDDAELKTKFAEMGNTPVTSTREALAAFVKEETARWATAAKASGTKVQ
jgi:tripartite-type tricarboxylate transporter receptor subunit TctC